MLRQRPIVARMVDTFDPAAPTPRHAHGGGWRLDRRSIDWIWHVRGSLPLARGQSADEAFDRLDPLFRTFGTTRERDGVRLTFRKKDQAAQDKMSVFDEGVLRIEDGAEGSVLHYHLISRILLLCFLAPLLFLAIAQLTIAANRFDKRPAEAAASSKTGKDKALPLNALDKALGAPAPEKKKEKGSRGRDKKPKPTAAYVFSAIFAGLYLVGRVLEGRMIRTLFKGRLADVKAQRRRA